MVDIDTFLTELYVMVDDFCKSELPAEHDGMCPRPGPDPSLCRSEIICMALFSQFGIFVSEHDFYRYASRHLRTAFPTLPARTQLNRLIRRHYSAITAFTLYLARLLKAKE